MSTSTTSDSQDERLFLDLVRNHAELRGNLQKLSLTKDLAAIDQRALEVARCWFRLAREHLRDAKAASRAKRRRSAYSRAYYAAYNASKAVRYRVYGKVSRSADDHKQASILPDDFPNASSWTPRIGELYEHRLRADYDNWRLTAQEQTLSPNECIAIAEQFLWSCRRYMRGKFGASL